jgi:hypothetical protein
VQLSTREEVGQPGSRSAALNQEAWALMRPVALWVTLQEFGDWGRISRLGM